MKVLDFAKKNKLLLAVALAYVVLALMAPTRAAGALSNSVYYLKEMVQVLPAIFFLTVVIEALVPKETIIRSFGEKSGFKGYLLALLLGSYALHSSRSLDAGTGRAQATQSAMLDADEWTDPLEQEFADLENLFRVMAEQPLFDLADL